MALSDMQVFNDFVMPAAMISLDQEIDKFNAASGGAIVLSSEGMTGDFMQESFFNSLASARRRVDRYAANGVQAGTALTESQEVSVKVAGGFGPVVYEPSQMSWLQRPTQEGVTKAGEAFARLLVQDQLNTIIAATVGAIANNPAVTNTIVGGVVTYAGINTAHSKFGDMSGNLVADVMTGSMYHKLVGANLNNAERLYTAGGVRVIDILGKVSIVTDAPALVSATQDKVLTLVAGGARVSGATDVLTNVQTVNGKTRIETSFQADYSFTVGVKGYAWDVANGGKSPADAALATGSNWDKVADFDKMTAGVITIGDL